MQSHEEKQARERCHILVRVRAFESGVLQEDHSIRGPMLARQEPETRRAQLPRRFLGWALELMDSRLQP